MALIGLRGAGKSAVGRCLAAAAVARFLDLDEELASEAGETSAGTTLARLGEAAFRELEARVLERVLAESKERREWLVLATGGGAVEHPESRALLARETTCVWLEARVATLRERVASDATPRPSLTGADPVEELDTLLRRRAAWYAELADESLDTERAGPEELARELLARLFPASRTEHSRPPGSAQ